MFNTFENCILNTWLMLKKINLIFFNKYITMGKETKLNILCVSLGRCRNKLKQKL